MNRVADHHGPTLLLRCGFAIIATLLTLISAVLVAGVAHAADANNLSDPHSLSIQLPSSSLTLNGGVNYVGYGGDTTRGFDPVVTESSTILRWTSSTVGGWNWQKPLGRWRIVEDGAETTFSIDVTESSTEASAYTQLKCEVVDYTVNPPSRVSGDALPYYCTVMRQATNDMIIRLSPVVWSSVAGSLSAEGSVGLDQGQQTSRNARFFVSDSLHKPTDPVANIDPGQTTSWSAEMRNGEGATADDGARTDFSYRILDDGEPTQYYVKGFMQNVKSLAGYKYTYECHIYSHDPDHGGTETKHSPYTCDYDATESGYSDSHLAAYFNVTTR